MVEGGGGPSFPVVFFDGERESNLGHININPTLEYKPFQLMLSQKIGISPNQISIYLVDRKRVPEWPFSEDRRRIPITGKVNFGAICRLKDCYFLVVLKRSRKSRNRRERAVSGVEFSDLSENEVSTRTMRSVPENLILLRRNMQRPFYDEMAPPDLVDLNYRLQNNMIERENYPMGMATSLSTPGSSFGHNLNPQAFLNMDSPLIADDWFPIPPLPSIAKSNETKSAYCQDCANDETNRSKKSFHHCVNDAVIHRFRTRFGPISRPSKPIP